MVVGGHRLAEGEYELALQTDDTGDDAGPGHAQLAAEAVRYVDPEGHTVDTGLVAALDTTVTPELHAEGVARDLVRLIQQARRDGGFDVTDRIALRLHLPDEQSKMIQAHRDQVAQSVLATTVEFVDDPGESSATLDGASVSWTIARA